MTELPAPEPSALSNVVVHLFKGPIYRDSHDKTWVQLVEIQAEVADYVSVIGLMIIVDENEGYAYLRSLPDDDATEGFPRLVARRSLSFHVSLLLALFRKRLAEHDQVGSTRLVMSRDEIESMLLVFLAESSNEAKTSKFIDTQINRVIDLGFLRKLRGSDDQFEVRRILKAFVDGHWLNNFDAALNSYLQEVSDQKEGG